MKLYEEDECQLTMLLRDHWNFIAKLLRLYGLSKFDIVSAERSYRRGAIDGWHKRPKCPPKSHIEIFHYESAYADFAKHRSECQ